MMINKRISRYLGNMTTSKKYKGGVSKEVQSEFVSSESLWDLTLALDPIKNWNVYSEDCDWYKLHTPAKSNDNHLRIGVWNVNKLTKDKVKNPGFLEGICLLILKSHIDVLFFQEVADLDVVMIIAEELNQSSLPHVVKFKNKFNLLQEWSSSVNPDSIGMLFQGKEYGAFINKKCEDFKFIKFTNLKENQLDGGKIFSRAPFLIEAQIKGERFLFISVHLKARSLNSADISKTTKEVMGLADLIRAFHDSHTTFDSLRKLGLGSIFDSQITSSSEHFKSRRNTKEIDDSKTIIEGAYDDVWLSSSLIKNQLVNPYQETFYTGNSGIIFDGLRHPFVSKDGIWNGLISDHGCLWLDINMKYP